MENLTKESDPVNNPSHYNSGVFPEVIKAMEMVLGRDVVKAFCQGNAFKYRMRAGMKGEGDDKTLEDIKKAMFYENYYRQLCEKDQQQSASESDQRVSRPTTRRTSITFTTGVH